MYSVVLMMAMTSGGDVADFGHRHGGCCGGYESYSSCCGGSYGYSSCCGGYSGCCGGGHHHHRHHHHGYSCCGGESYGCCGGYSVVADCGCGVVATGCTGGVVTGGEEPVGPGHTDTVKGGGADAAALTAEEKEHMKVLIEANADQKEAIESYFKGASHEERKKYYDENKPADKKDGDKKDKKDGDKKDKKDGDTLAPAPATIIVSLPANATLTIDDAATTSTAATRVFTSPVLPVGRDFHYVLKAQIVRDGKTLVVSKEVTVRAGQTTRATLEASLANVASR